MDRDNTRPVDLWQPGNAIHELRAQNFRSFRRLDLNLGRVNVFVGANASGKSNVLFALRFLRDLAANGLNDALGLQGGIELVTNAGHRGAPVSLEVAYSQDEVSEFIQNLFESADGSPIRYGGPRYTYYLSVQANGGQRYNILTDRLLVHVAFEVEGRPHQTSDYGERNIVIRLERRDDTLGFFFVTPASAKLKPSPLLDFISTKNLPIPLGSTVFEQDAALFDFRPSAFFKDVPIYDFDPDLARDAIFVEGRARLDDDAENLPLVLRRLFEDPERRIEFKRLIRSFLPYVSDVEIETYSDMSSIINVTETFSKTALPASAVSTGTIDVFALLTAVYYDECPVIAIEEPERYIHAALVPRVAELLRTRADQRQFFVTTHDSRMISELAQCTVFALYRDDGGYSRAVEPTRSPVISRLLTEDLGIDDLNAVGLLHE